MANGFDASHRASFGFPLPRLNCLIGQAVLYCIQVTAPNMNAYRRSFRMQQNPRHREGQGLVEYALILVLVAVVVIVILALLGPAIGNIFSNIINSLNPTVSPAVTPTPAP